jgi:hypothetical protein
MTIYVCDICKKEVSSLKTLTDRYKTKDISQACGVCIERVDDYVFEVCRAQSIELTNKVKVFIKQLQP